MGQHQFEKPAKSRSRFFEQLDNGSLSESSAVLPVHLPEKTVHNRMPVRNFREQRIAGRLPAYAHHFPCVPDPYRVSPLRIAFEK